MMLFRKSGSSFHGWTSESEVSSENKCQVFRTWPWGARHHLRHSNRELHYSHPHTHSILCRLQLISIISPTTLHIQPAMPSTTAETLSLVNRNVSVAPLVLLSATDHYARSAKGTRKRVVGVLLGQNDGKNVRVSNSFAGTLPPLCCTHDILTVASQCRSRRTKRTRPSGSLTTTTSNP
jgi:hypothetical protein